MKFNLGPVGPTVGSDRRPAIRAEPWGKTLPEFHYRCPLGGFLFIDGVVVDIRAFIYSDICWRGSFVMGLNPAEGAGNLVS